MHCVLWHFAQFVGLRFIYYKFRGRPANVKDFKEPPSGPLWLVSIYIAAFSLAVQQYGRALNTELIIATNFNTGDNLDESLGNEYCAAMRQYKQIVTMTPRKPELWPPTRIVESLLGQRIPSMDAANTAARELESMAQLIMIHASSNVRSERLEREFPERKSPDFGLRIPHSKLRLDQPYRHERIEIDQKGNVEVRWSSRPEPVRFFRAITAENLEGICADALSFKMFVASPSDQFDRYECTDVVLSRACHETRNKITKGMLKPISPESEKDETRDES